MGVGPFAFRYQGNGATHCEHIDTTRKAMIVLQLHKTISYGTQCTSLKGSQKENQVSKNLAPCGTDGQLLLSGFQLLVTLTFTLDQIIQHMVMHHSSTSIYTPCSIEIGKTFLWRPTAGTAPSSRSRDTKTSKNFKNPARTNLDIVL